MKSIIKDKTHEWDQTAITPGTAFMTKLGKEITLYYKKNTQIIVSTSDDIGEGEHKIFQFIRDNPKKNRPVAIRTI